VKPDIPPITLSLTGATRLYVPEVLFNNKKKRVEMNSVKNAVVNDPDQTERSPCKKGSIKHRAAKMIGITVTMLGIAHQAQAVTASQVANIYSGISFFGEYYSEQDLGPLDSNPKGFTRFRNELVFSAEDFSTGQELWVYDGRQVRQIADINPQFSINDFPPAGSSSPADFVVFGNQLLFTADNGSSGRELWSYDGKEVRQVADINSGPAGSSPRSFTVFGNELVFIADDGVHGQELWSYDGTQVSLLADINPLGAASPSGLTAFGDELVFRANGGSANGGTELWAYDGSQVRRIADIRPGSPSSSPSGFTVFNGELVFYATDGFSGLEPWAYDGNQIRQLADIRAGLPGSAPIAVIMRVIGNELVFSANDGTTGIEPWSYDGKQVRQLADINPLGDSNPGGLVKLGAELVFSASSSNPSERTLWSYDGKQVRQIADGPWIPLNLTAVADKLVAFSAIGESGRELWAYDGRQVYQLADINPAGSSEPANLTVFGNELIFSANDGATGNEVWRIVQPGVQ
jgi:ELWxxDGT repeat protein